jgi:hypothetical protein
MTDEAMRFDGIDEDLLALLGEETTHNPLELPEVRADRREAVFRLLAGCGVATADAEYDGAGDEGCVGTITARGAGGEVIPLPGEVEEAVGDFVSDTLPRGWEIDAGSDGTVTFDVAARRVRYAHYARYTEVSYDEWEG